MKHTSYPNRLLNAFAAILVAVFVSQAAVAQICKPVKERTGEVGCWITANTSLGLLPKEPIFWHLYSYPTKADAESARTSRSTVVESLGKIWLFTIDVEKWHPSKGERVAVIGPLPVTADINYSSQ